MTARRWTTIAGAAFATAVAAALAASGQAETADPLSQTRPRGIVADCSKGSGIGRGSLSEFGSRWNLVVGPLAMSGGAANPGYYSESFGGNKFPLYVRSGHRVTVEVSRGARPGAGLAYGQLPRKRDGYRVITFISCRRGEFSPGLGSAAGRVSFWSGGVLARSPRCVPLLIWVDDEPRPRRAVIHLGVGTCGSSARP